MFADPQTTMGSFSQKGILGSVFALVTFNTILLQLVPNQYYACFNT